MLDFFDRSWKGSGVPGRTVPIKILPVQGPQERVGKGSGKPLSRGLRRIERLNDGEMQDAGWKDRGGGGSI